MLLASRTEGSKLCVCGHEDVDHWSGRWEACELCMCPKFHEAKTCIPEGKVVELGVTDSQGTPQSEMIGAFYGDEIHVVNKATGEVISLSDHPNLERVILLLCDGYFRRKNGQAG